MGNTVNTLFTYYAPGFRDGENLVYGLLGFDTVHYRKVIFGISEEFLPTFFPI
jgi:hypothetical protein